MNEKPAPKIITRKEYLELYSPNKIGIIRKSKYGAIRVKEDGHTFDSIKEHRRYCELRLLLQAGHIRQLKVHPRFPLTFDGRTHIGSVEFDFTYFEDPNAPMIVEDVKTKPTDTRLSKWKRAHFEAEYGLKVRLV